ncbi:biotin--[acetyl-CoA-carboxylase] ligase [Bryocella elongata]|uniref:biotin--[acetyl-CoA-carboxylase] ligase n=1 Tax=Bryocella elongata TaxID=863522 RepID=UPI001F16B69E|nr:biotin--[acetyl-CoA-carboxylase] ligase [Bryocella elongata]
MASSSSSKGADLNPAALNVALMGTRFAGRVHHFAHIGSTSTALLESAAEGAPEGTVYLADEQTAGRGRGGHAWHSAPGDGLYLSALVKPSLALRDALLLSLATGLAAWQAIHEVSGVSVDLRWPNDLLASRDGRSRKVGGILVETSVEPGADPLLRYAVIGVGINVHHAGFPAELASLATSLALESELPVFRGPIALSLLRQIDLELTRLELGGGQKDLLARFTERSSWVLGKRVSVPEQGGYTGVTAGLDAQGYLLVDGDDGVVRTVRSGGVREIETN